MRPESSASATCSECTRLMSAKQIHIVFTERYIYSNPPTQIEIGGWSACPRTCMGEELIFFLVHFEVLVNTSVWSLSIVEVNVLKHSISIDIHHMLRFIPVLCWILYACVTYTYLNNLVESVWWSNNIINLNYIIIYSNRRHQLNKWLVYVIVTSEIIIQGIVLL